MPADERAAALSRHLDEFKRFVVALHHLAGADVRFRRPLSVSLPFVLPGTGLRLDGDGCVAIAGIGRGRLRIERDGRPIEIALEPGRPGSSDLALVRSPVARHGGCELFLEPRALSAAGVDIADSAVAAGPEYQAQHVPLLTEALRLLERFAPRTFVAFRDVMRVVALKPPAADEFTNTSHSDLPGASVLTVVEHPYEIADSLIHEFHHHVLFALEERGDFFSAGQDGVHDERYYSPWRPDRRPLRGVLLGVHVHLPVSDYWLRVHGAEDVDEATRGYALDRVLRFTAQVALGISVLERHARFSRFGREVWISLRAGYEELCARVAAAALPDDAPARVCRADGAIEPERGRDGRALGVREVVAEHRRCHDPEAAPAP